MVLIKVVLSFTNCARSLSPVDTITSIFFSFACFDSVPITSSASTPFSISIGHPIALIALFNGSICIASSSGILGRLALYSLKISFLKVFPLASKIQTL